MRKYDHGLWALLPRIAAAKGYTIKIVGDFAWRKGTAKVGRDIKLMRFKGYRGGKLQVYETGVGYYELDKQKVNALLARKDKQ